MGEVYVPAASLWNGDLSLLTLTAQWRWAGCRLGSGHLSRAGGGGGGYKTVGGGGGASEVIPLRKGQSFSHAEGRAENILGWFWGSFGVAIKPPFQRGGGGTKTFTLS